MSWRGVTEAMGRHANAGRMRHDEVLAGAGVVVLYADARRWASRRFA